MPKAEGKRRARRRPEWLKQRVRDSEGDDGGEAGWSWVVQGAIGHGKTRPFTRMKWEPQRI